MNQCLALLLASPLALGAQPLETVDVHGPSGEVRTFRIAGNAREREDFVFYEEGLEHNSATRRWLTARVSVWPKTGADAEAIARAVHAVAVERPVYAKTAAIFSAPNPPAALAMAKALRERPDVDAADPLLARMRTKRFTPNDTYFAYNATNAGYQWHLRNTGQNGGTAGVDLNLQTVWDTRRGAGIRIGIIDDGVQGTHPDLAPNLDLANAYDWNEFDTDPSPYSYDAHGTSCAGLAVARSNNGAGISGVAPEAALVPLRLIAGPITDVEEAAALSWRNNLIPIKSSSWGPPDDGASLDGPEPLAQAAIEDGILHGRGGLGTIYVWSAGDGGAADNANFDGYANSVFGIAVGSLNDQGNAPNYGEPGANILISTPSSSTGRQSILTTDLLGPNGSNNGSLTGEVSNADYTNTFGGTSASAPLAAGAIALILEANPGLGWRDVKEILIRSAAKNSPSDPGWSNNGAGFHFNHKFGAGLLDVQAAVDLATTWTNLGPMTQMRKALTNINAPIPDSPAPGVTSTFTIAANENLRVESVAVDVGFSHALRGEIEVKLTSPSGTVSQLSTQRPNDTFPGLFWKYTSVRHWGENATGTWTVTVSDKAVGTTGTLNTLVLWLYGSDSAIDVAPVVNSALTANGTVGTVFSYRIFALNSPASFSASGLPEGLSIATQTGLISGIPRVDGTFNVGIGATNASGTGTKTLVLTVAPWSAAIAAAVDQPTLVWEGEGDALWTVDTLTTQDAVDAARTGAIPDNGTSSLRTYVNGPAILRFWWRVSSELDSDLLYLWDNGNKLAGISGEEYWARPRFYLGPGLHRLEWFYIKDPANTAGSDGGWLDRVEILPVAQSPPVITRQPTDIFVPTNSLAFLRAEAVGALPISYQWYRQGLPINGATSPTFVLSSASQVNFGSYTCVVSNGLGSATSDPALIQIGQNATALGTAVDNSSLSWVTFGDASWASQTSITHDGIDAARSGSILNSGSTSMSTGVFGPGTLTFWWRVRSEEGGDILDFEIDGEQMDYITGTVEWKQVIWQVSPGAHRLEWKYSKNESVAAPTDTGWVDQVVYTQKPYAAWATSNFTLEQRVSDTFAGYDSDPNGDGVSNMLAYAFGISPTSGAGGPLPFISFDGTNYSLVYQKSTTATDVTFSVQRASNFSTWSAVPTTDSVLSTNGSLRTIRATLPPVAGAPWFYRVQVSFP